MSALTQYETYGARSEEGGVSWHGSRLVLVPPGNRSRILAREQGNPGAMIVPGGIEFRTNPAATDPDLAAQVTRITWTERL